MSDKLWSLWQRYLRRIRTRGHMSQCDSVLETGNVGWYCQKLYSHDGPHSDGQRLWFRWTNSFDKEGVLVIEPQHIGAGEHGDFLRINGVCRYFKDGQQIETRHEYGLEDFI